MELACLDLEGVLVPEIWIALAERTGIDELRATTRDIPDYDVLMKRKCQAPINRNRSFGAWDILSPSSARRYSHTLLQS